MDFSRNFRSPNGQKKSSRGQDFQHVINVAVLRQFATDHLLNWALAPAILTGKKIPLGNLFLSSKGTFLQEGFSI
jgi:hypothetical protein